MFNSLTAFADLTTRKVTRKPRQAFKLVFPPDPSAGRSIEALARRTLERPPFYATTLPQHAVLALRVWYHARAKAAGAEIVSKPSAAERAHDARLREEAEVQGQGEEGAPSREGRSRTRGKRGGGTR